MPAFLIKPFAKMGIVILIFAAAFAYRAVLIHERDHARTIAAQCKADLDAAVATNTAMAQMIEKQNGAVAELKKKSDDAANRADLFAAMGVKARANAAAIVKATAQKSIGPSCREAMDDLKRGVNGSPR